MTPSCSFLLGDLFRNTIITSLLPIKYRIISPVQSTAYKLTSNKENNIR